MRRLAWTFTARIGYKYQIRLTRPIYQIFVKFLYCLYMIFKSWNYFKRKLNTVTRHYASDSNMQCVIIPSYDMMLWHSITATSYEPCHEKTCLPGFLTRSDSNRPAQPQKLSRGLKFQILKLEVLYHLGSGQQMCYQTAQMRRLICTFVGHIWHKQTCFLKTRLIWKKI